ncbi:MAG: DUF481 domain-containing protein [Gammaproteobacteria bacterium]|jgi:putative salt-induced outer membrane protein
MVIGKYFSAICLLSLVSSAVMAATTADKPTTPTQQSTAKPKSPWSGEAEVGILMTRGNTHTDTQNIKLGVQYTTGPWQHQLKLESLHAQDNNVVSADRFSAAFRSTYQIGEKAYAFGNLKHLNDRFSGFESRNTEVVGYGRKLYRLPTFTWDVEVGLGARQTHYTDDTQANDGIVRLATELNWKFTPTSEFKQHINVESGSANTSTTSSSSLKLKVNSSLAMKLGLNVQNNSTVPPGKKHTDTITSVTLVYDFTG